MGTHGSHRVNIKAEIEVMYLEVKRHQRSPTNHSSQERGREQPQDGLPTP